ncbi:MAG: arylsulfatase A-like enzyme [Myxococcota bacterium]|jgi:arylsulfatase A-like enzyme
MSEPSTSLRGYFLLCGFGVLPIYLAEFMGAIRVSHWFAMTPGEWLESFTPSLTYWLILSVSAFAVGHGLDRFFKPTAPRRMQPTALLVALIGVFYLTLDWRLNRSVQAELDYGFLASASAVVLVGCLTTFSRFSATHGLLAGIGATASATLTFLYANYTSPIGTPSYGPAVNQSLLIAAVFCAAAIAIGFLGAKLPRLGYAVAVGCCCAGVALPIATKLQTDREASARTNSGPNILILTADTLRADYTSAYGGIAPTPTLEKLARDGAKFEHAISLAPWTVPSLSGMMTSKYPPSVVPHSSPEAREEQLTLYGQIPEYWLGQREQTIVKSLADNGYQTGVVMGNFAMDRQTWLLDEFEDQIVIPFMPTTYLGPLIHSPFLLTLLGNFVPWLYESRPDDTTRAVTELAQRYIRYQGGERFFLWVHYFDPHTPYHPPDPFRTEIGPFPVYPFFNDELDRVHQGYIRSLYANEITYVDQAMGEVLDVIEEQQLTEQTFVIASSDHGEELWERNTIGHGQSMFDELLRVPLIIKGPGIPTQTVEKLVSLIDIVPTIASWAGQPVDSEWRGKSLSDALVTQNFTDTNDHVFATATGVLPSPREPFQAVLHRRHKLVRGMESGTYELFNRVNDPEEAHDIAIRHPRIVRQLGIRLKNWADSYPSTFDEFGADGDMPAPDAQMLENLRALGYLPEESTP